MFFGENSNDPNASQEAILSINTSGDNSIFFSSPQSESIPQEAISIPSMDTAPSEPITTKRKRGRPPKSTRPPCPPPPSTGRPHTKPSLGILRPPLSSFQLDSDDSDPQDSSNEWDHKRRRSSLGSLDQALLSPTNSYNGSAADLASAAAIRRSNRGRKIDTTRNLVVLLPDMDPRSVLDIRGESDWEGLQQALTFPLAADQNCNYDSDASATAAFGPLTLPPGPKVEVVTPKVTFHKPFHDFVQPATIPWNPVIPEQRPPSTNARASRRCKGGNHVNGGLPGFHTVQGGGDKASLGDLRVMGQQHSEGGRGDQSYTRVYADYDASSDDEALIHELNEEVASQQSQLYFEDSMVFLPGIQQVLTPRLLEQLICRLEREMELARRFSQPFKEAQKVQSNCNETLLAAKSTVAEVKAFAATGDLSLLHRLLLPNPSSSSSLEDGTLPRSISITSLPDDQSIQPCSSSSSRSIDPSSSHAAVGTEKSTTITSLHDRDCHGVAPIWGVEEIQQLLPEERALVILLPLIAQADLRAYSGIAREGNGGAIGAILNDCERQYVARRIYKHWLVKATHCGGRSLLRVFHRHRTTLWSPSEELCSLSSDYTTDTMHSAWHRLAAMRRGLDRSRLIIDRVRRREKWKRDLLKVNLDILTFSGLVSASLPSSSSFSTSSVAIASTFGVQSVRPGSEGLGSYGSAPRKRGRPRRSDSLQSTSSCAPVVSKPLVSSKAPSTSGPVVSVAPLAEGESAGSGSTAVAAGLLQVKFVQGRDRFGKFLKKSAVLVPTPLATSLGVVPASTSASTSMPTTTNSVTGAIVTTSAMSHPVDLSNGAAARSLSSLSSKDGGDITSNDAILLSPSQSTENVLLADSSQCNNDSVSASTFAQISEEELLQLLAANEAREKRSQQLQEEKKNRDFQPPAGLPSAGLVIKDELPQDLPDFGYPGLLLDFGLEEDMMAELPNLLLDQ
eukprot:scaffold3341_cov165-Ochromonas_danica.AAC.2